MLPGMGMADHLKTDTDHHGQTWWLKHHEDVVRAAHGDCFMEIRTRTDLNILPSQTEVSLHLFTLYSFGHFSSSLHPFCPSFSKMSLLHLKLYGECFFNTYKSSFTIFLLHLLCCQWRGWTVPPPVVLSLFSVWGLTRLQLCLFEQVRGEFCRGAEHLDTVCWIDVLQFSWISKTRIIQKSVPNLVWNIQMRFMTASVCVCVSLYMQFSEE